MNDAMLEKLQHLFDLAERGNSPKRMAAYTDELSGISPQALGPALDELRNTWNRPVPPPVQTIKETARRLLGVRERHQENESAEVQDLGALRELRALLRDLRPSVEASDVRGFLEVAGAPRSDDYPAALAIQLGWILREKAPDRYENLDALGRRWASQLDAAHLIEHGADAWPPPLTMFHEPKTRGPMFSAVAASLEDGPWDDAV